MLDPRTLRLCAMAAAAVSLTAFAPGPAFARQAGPQEALLHVWAPDKPTERLLGGAPLTPEAARLYASRAAERRQPDAQFDRTRWCAGPGMPRIMLMPYPFEIKAERGYLAMLFGWYRWYRLIDLSGQDPDVVLPTTMGYSVGRWEGRSLVVRTTGLAAETVLDASGLPHSEGMTLTERLRVLPNGHLEVRFTIDDGAYYTRPWTSVATYHRVSGVSIEDDICPDRLRRGEPAVAGAAP